MRARSAARGDGKLGDDEGIVEGGASVRVSELEGGHRQVRDGPAAVRACASAIG
ncbi:MAG: hypothetical protein ABJZ69_13310 [Hyphomicrobiales bacterium]